MNKNLIIGAFAVIVIAVVGGMVLKNGNGSDGTLPLVQITTPSAYVLDAKGARSKELSDGDTLTPPTTIEVAEGGSASVNFPDGSIARIQGGTTFTVKSVAYNKTTGTSNIHIFISIGRLWSKVIELATPDSSWEVETETAVAAVRGTAFDTRVTADVTLFAGSENAVTVAPIDPNAHKRLETAAIAMGQGKMVEIKDSVLEDVIAGKAKLTATTLLDTEKRSTWFASNESEDAEVNAFVKTLRDRGLSGAELQSEIRAKLREEMKKRSGDASDSSSETGTRSTLSNLLKSGKSQKCTFAFDAVQAKSEGTVYLSGSKMRGDFKISAAVGDNTVIENHIVRDNDWTYVWMSTSPQGFKMRTTDNGVPGDLGGQGAFDYNQTMNYNCSVWSGGDAIFTPPSDITFTAL